MAATTVVGLFGAGGRMGSAIQQVCSDLDGVGCVALARDATHVPGEVDVLVDFSSPTGLQRALALAQAAQRPLLSGSTGLETADHDALDLASRDLPILWASNTSLGVALLSQLVREAARRLPLSFDVEIIEAHHRRKQDAPSGTALTLLEAVAVGRSSQNMPAGSPVFGREGWVGPRSTGTVGVHAVRGGTIVGDHEVLFLGEHEQIRLSHRAEDRLLFARGAVVAARWLVAQPAGRYTMADVVG